MIQPFTGIPRLNIFWVPWTPGYTGAYGTHHQNQVFGYGLIPNKELPTKEQYRQWLEERFGTLPSHSEGGGFQDFYSALRDALVWCINVDRTKDSWVEIRNTMKGATGVHRRNVNSYEVPRSRNAYWTFSWEGQDDCHIITLQSALTVITRLTKQPWRELVEHTTIAKHWETFGRECGLKRRRPSQLRNGKNPSCLTQR